MNAVHFNIIWKLIRAEDSNDDLGSTINSSSNNNNATLAMVVSSRNATFYALTSDGDVSNAVSRALRDVLMDTNDTSHSESGSVTGSPSDLEASDEAATHFFRFVTYGVLITFIGIMGVAGNVLSIVVLSRPQMRSSINCCLIGLATFDILLLVTSVLMLGLDCLCEYTGSCLEYHQSVHPYITPFVYPLAMIAQTGSVWVTVSVTIERYVAVCLPLHAKSLCTYGRARIYIIVIAVFSFVYNIPRFWEVDRVEMEDDVHNVTRIMVLPSNLRNNQSYKVIYIHWMYLFVMYLIPFVLLALLNGLIWRKVHQANKERQQLSRLQKKEISLAIMLFCVVVVFFMCNILALVTNILEIVGDMIDEMTQSSNLLVTINSSVNFVIYCIFGRKFRRILLRTICTCCPERFQVTRMGRGRDLEESCMYPISSVNNAETKPLMRCNGSGMSVRVSMASTTVIDSLGRNNGSTTSVKPTSSNSSLTSVGVLTTTKSVSPIGISPRNHSYGGGGRSFYSKKLLTTS